MNINAEIICVLAIVQIQFYVAEHNQHKAESQSQKRFCEDVT